MGNQNCHAEIIFEDNVRWLARFRLTKTSSPPREVRDWITRSEVATMLYLQQNTCIPTPKIYAWACESDPKNTIGASYIFMEKLEGKPLTWTEATPEQRERVLQQMVGIFLEIEKHPFHSMGSLVFSETNTWEVGGLAHQSTFQVGKGPLGSFSSSLEGIKTILDAYITMIVSGEIDAPCPVDAYLVHRDRLDNVHLLWGDSASGGPFFLKHPDDKGDHILVNDNYDIVGIIDWEWTQTASKAEAFCSPCMLWPVDEFYSGSNALAPDELRLAEIFREKGREDLATCVLEGRKVQRFLFALGPEISFLDENVFVSLFEGLQAALHSKGREAWECWRTRALENWKNEEILLELQQSERDASRATTIKNGLTIG